MNELIFEDGKIEVRESGRIAFTTEGTLVNLLPTSSELNLVGVLGTFPNFTKNNQYYWSGQRGGGWVTEGCTSWGTVIPQEWNNFSSPIVLGALPGDGIDFLDIQCRCSRVVNPSTWMGAPIPKLVPEGQWFDVSGGSFLLEASVGMSRAAHVVVSGNNVVLQLQQSVATAPSGHTSNPLLNQGVTHGGTAGIPVTVLENKVQTYQDFGVAFAFTRVGVSPCSTTDTSNHLSTWQFDFRIAFGRRS